MTSEKVLANEGVESPKTLINDTNDRLNLVEVKKRNKRNLMYNRNSIKSQNLSRRR